MSTIGEYHGIVYNCRMRRERIVVALYGFPGSGKGTQANLVANTFGLVNFDTGKHLESIWYDPKRQEESLVKREKALFDGGKLNTPSFVLSEVERELKIIAKERLGVVYSGSPRTLFEAEGLIPMFEKLYGKKRVFFFYLDVAPKDSIKRNSRRMLCTKCKAMLLALYYPSKKPKYCPVCAGSLYRRTLDNPKVIVERIKEYNKRTAPILSFLRKRGHKVIKVNGKLAPYKVFEGIERAIRSKIV
jgi:adenylate kinase